jgi:biopolymer transport protein ExbD
VRRPEQARPDINVTPLVDVVLVLLIIFMVIVPQMEAGASVKLPGVEHPDPTTDAQHSPLTVSLTKGGRLYLEKQPVERDRLIDLLKQAHAAAPSRRVVLKADKDVQYGHVRELFREAQQIGFPGISLQTGDKSRRKPGAV